MARTYSEMSENARIVEVILYVENEGLSVQRIAELSGLTEIEVGTALAELKDISQNLNRGLVLIEEDGLYCFTASQDLYERLRKSYGRKVDRRLSKASMETLSIIAYSQPITRKEIDNIRGVSSDTIVRILREREYIKVVGRKDVKGHPCLYGTSRKFLYDFNLQSIADLPRLSEIDTLRFNKDEDDEENDNE